MNCKFASVSGGVLTYVDGAGAGHGGARAGVARADADDGDGATGKANQASQVLEDDTDAAQQGRSSSRVGLRTSLSVKWFRRCIIELTGIVLWQHWVVGVSVRATGVAAARTGRTRAVTAKRRENIVLYLRVLNCVCCAGE